VTLTWEATYAIAMELSRRHRDAVLEELSLNQIYAWTLDLPEFDDQPELCNDGILSSIFQEWYEVKAHEQTGTQ
jgi:FeS assembly protein IscX